MYTKIIIEKDLWDILASLGILIVGAITSYVAYKQHKTDKDKLKLELYDKRFAVFRAVMDLNAIIFRDANVSTKDLQIFLVNTREATFLFDEELKKEVDDVYSKAVRLRYVEHKLSDDNLSVGKERTELAEESASILNWFGDVPRRFERLFEKYLSLKKL